MLPVCEYSEQRIFRSEDHRQKTDSYDVQFLAGSV